MKISIVGDICIDKNTSEHASYTAAGGPAVFMSKIFQQFPGSEVTITSCYGSDFASLQSTIPAEFYPGPTIDKTLVYENISTARERIQKVQNSALVQWRLRDARIRDTIARADLIFVAPLLPQFPATVISQIYDWKNPAVPIILLPQGYFRQITDASMVVPRQFEEAQSILPHTSVVIVSEQDAPNMLGLARSWFSLHPELVVIITAAEKGALVVTRNQETMIGTIPVSSSAIIDSVGAGDVFSAGFGFWYRQTQDVSAAVRFANAIARQRLFFPADQIAIDVSQAISDAQLPSIAGLQ